MDAVTGEIKPNGLLDYELIDFDVNPASPWETQRLGEDDSRLFVLIMRAYDLGRPSKYSDVPVNIFITDQNDHSPQFEKSHYEVNIDEDTKGGSSIFQVCKF